MTRRGWALFISLGLIWGLPYLLIRVCVREVSPAFLVFVRTSLGAALLAPFAWRAGAMAQLLRHWRALVSYTLVEIAVPWWFLSAAEEKVTSSLSGMLIAAVPLAGAVIAKVTGTDRLDRRRASGLGLGLVGVGTLVGFDVGAPDLLATSSFLLVVTGYALGPWVLSRYFSGLPGIVVVEGSLLLAALAYLPAAVAQHPATVPSTDVLASLAGLGVLCTAVAFVIFFELIGEVGPMRATVVTYLNPAVAAVLGVAVLGEHFGPAMGAGFVLVLGGSFLATRPLRPRRPAGVGEAALLAQPLPAREP